MSRSRSPRVTVPVRIVEPSIARSALDQRRTAGSANANPMSRSAPAAIAASTRGLRFAATGRSMEEVFSIMTGGSKRNRYAMEPSFVFSDLRCPIDVRRTFVRGQMSAVAVGPQQRLDRRCSSALHCSVLNDVYNSVQLGDIGVMMSIGGITCGLLSSDSLLL